MILANSLYDCTRGRNADIRKLSSLRTLRCIHLSLNSQEPEKVPGSGAE